MTLASKKSPSKAKKASADGTKKRKKKRVET